MDFSVLSISLPNKKYTIWMGWKASLWIPHVCFQRQPCIFLETFSMVKFIKFYMLVNIETSAIFNNINCFIKQYAIHTNRININVLKIVLMGNLHVHYKKALCQYIGTICVMWMHAYCLLMVFILWTNERFTYIFIILKFMIEKYVVLRYSIILILSQIFLERSL